MEMVKKEPSTFTEPANQSSKPLGGSAAMGADFGKVKIEQRQTSGGNANTMSGVSGSED